ncbi:hypothetical protein GAW91_004347 [Vibrio fluvialis]|nr:hypothetical protein [Vibrio fluvialis]
MLALDILGDPALILSVLVRLFPVATVIYSCPGYSVSARVNSFGEAISAAPFIFFIKWSRENNMEQLASIGCKSIAKIEKHRVE